MSEQNILTSIFEQKRRRVRAGLERRTLGDVRAAAHASRDETERHTFKRALAVEWRVNVIAEFKRASPSKGVIRSDLTAREVARLYERGGAAAISVLTEEDNFGGSLRDLAEVKAESSLPVLRKDFIFDEWQVYESAAAGADALLLITAMLDDEALARLRRLTEDALGMDALVEVHTADELRRATGAGASLVGVNNRDLRDFRVSIETSLELAAHAPRNVLLVSESGIRDRDDIERLSGAGYSAFLVGETLMRAELPEDALRQLIS